MSSRIKPWRRADRRHQKRKQSWVEKEARRLERLKIQTDEADRERLGRDNELADSSQPE